VINKIQATDQYQSGQFFTPEEVAQQLGITTTRTLTWLKDMAYEGLLIAKDRPDINNGVMYSAPPKLKNAMLRKPWKRRKLRDVQSTQTHRNSP